MTKKYGNEVLYIKRKGKFRRFFKRLFYVVFTITIAVLFGGMFSSIGDSSLGIHILGQRDRVKISAKTYYALNMGTYANLDDAKSTANVVIQAGGGGYIWKTGQNYVVLGSIYLNEKDCNKVVENIAEQYKASVYKIKLPKCNFVVEDITRNERKTIQKSVEYCNEIFESLYEISIDYDTGKISNIAVGAKVNSLKSQVSSKKSEIYNLYTKYNVACLNSIHSTYLAIEDVMDLLINQMLTVENNQHLVKYAFMEIMDNCYKLRNNLR